MTGFGGYKKSYESKARVTHAAHFLTNLFKIVFQNVLSFHSDFTNTVKKDSWVQLRYIRLKLLALTVAKP